MNSDSAAASPSENSFSVTSDFKEPDNSAQRRPSIRELLSRSDSSEAFESLSRGEYVGNLLSIVLSRTTGLSSPSASICAGDSKCEVKFQPKSRYGRENRRSFLRSLSSMRDEDEDIDHLTSTPIISGSEDSDENPDISALPRVRRKSFIFNDHALSKAGLLERGLVLHHSPSRLPNELPIELTASSEKLPPITNRRGRDCTSFIATTIETPPLASPLLTRTKSSRFLATNILNSLPGSPQLCASPILDSCSTYTTSGSTSTTTSNSTSNTSTRCGSPLFTRSNPLEIQIPCPPRSRALRRSQSESVDTAPGAYTSSSFSPSASLIAMPTTTHQSPSPTDSKGSHTVPILTRHESIRTLPRLPSLLEEILAPMGGRNLSPAPMRESPHTKATEESREFARRRAYSPVSVTDSVSPSQSCRPTLGMHKTIPKVNKSHN